MGHFANPFPWDTVHVSGFMLLYVYESVQYLF